MTGRRVRRAAVAAAVAGLLTVLLAPMALAAGEKATLSVRGIDGTKNSAVKVTFLWTGDATKLSTLTLREDGDVKKVDDLTDLAKTETRLATVFVVDVSGSMDDRGNLTKVKEGLSSYADTMPDGDEMGIVSYHDLAVVESQLTDNPAQLAAAIDALATPADGKTGTYDALKKAVTLFDRKDGLQPNVVLVTDGTDDVSTTDLPGAKAALVGSDAGFFALELDHLKEVDHASIESIAARTGGTTVSVASAGAVTGSFETITEMLHDQYVATYASTAKQGQVSVSLNVDGVDRNASYVAGSKVTGAATGETVAAKSGFGPKWLRTKGGGLAGLALVGLAVGLGAFALASLAGRTDESLQAVLRPYSEGPAPEDGNDGALAQTAFLQRAVEITEDFAQRQGILVKVERALERADLPLRPAEALFFHGAGVLILSLGAFALAGFTLGVIVLVVAGILPPAVVNFIASRRSKAFQSSLPDTLQLLSGSLRAGYSLLQGVEAVSKEVQDPMGKELRRVMTEARLGREVEDALEAVADRMASADFAWAVMAVRIQREVGGNLSELLLTVSDTMVHRERLRRDVAALTAEGKISAIILGLLPIGLGAFMWISNPVYMKPLGATTMGNVLLGVAIVAGVAGFAWMKKIININI